MARNWVLLFCGAAVLPAAGCVDKTVTDDQTVVAMGIGELLSFVVLSTGLLVGAYFLREKHLWCFVMLACGVLMLLGAFASYTGDRYIIGREGFEMTRSTGLFTTSSTEVKYKDIHSVGGKQMLMRKTWTAARIPIGEPYPVYDLRIMMKDNTRMDLSLRSEIGREAADPLLLEFARNEIPIRFDR